MAPDTIVGRERELDAVTRFLNGGAKCPRALLIEGDAGIGKTTLWHEASRIAGADSRLLTARPSESEAKLSFSVLTDLLGLTLDEIRDQLPVSQRRALEAALLLAPEADSVDARAVSLATLGALRSLVASTPITIAIDDVQWVDAPSARSLSFAFRRLVDEPITVIATSRIAPGLREPIGLAAMMTFHGIELGPISRDGLARAFRLLELPFPGPLLERIHETSGGNPFYAIEIGRALVRSPSPPRAGEPLPVPDDLHALLRERLTILSAEARDALLVAAASTTPTSDLVEAVQGSDIALEEAARAGIITLRGSEVEFTHPLFASAVYADAAPSTRRRVHERLAATSTDLEANARHLALASSGDNEEVASSLERAAVRARARGAPQSAAELSELAVTATSVDDLVARQRRVQMQAGNLFDAGDPRRAREIIDALIVTLGPGPRRAEARYVLSWFCWKDLDLISRLLEQASLEVGEEMRLRSRILADRAWVALDSGRIDEAARHAGTAVELAELLDDNSYDLRHGLAILALARSLMGLESRALFDRAVSLQGPLVSAELSSPATCLGRQLTWVSELDGARTTLEAELDRYREQGHEMSRYEMLACLADVEVRAGRFDQALMHLGEADDIAADSGLDVAGEILPVRAAVACLTGDLDGAHSDAVRGVEVCERTHDLWNGTRCRSVLGFLEISRDDPAAAHGWLEPLPAVVDGMGIREPGAFPFLPDAIDALIGVDDLPRADELAVHLEERGRALDRPLAIGTAARAKGSIAAARGDLLGAATWLDEATEILRPTPHPFELARSLLVAGEVQRRLRKKSSTRTLLGASLEIFEEIGAEPWAAKARRALARIGGRPPTPLDLTPSEEQVARLVAAGHTNREVASALFVSVHTVESNLKRIYRKLGVRSRVELTTRLPDQPGS